MMDRFEFPKVAESGVLQAMQPHERDWFETLFKAMHLNMLSAEAEGVDAKTLPLGLIFFAGFFIGVQEPGSGPKPEIISQAISLALAEGQKLGRNAWLAQQMAAGRG